MDTSVTQANSFQTALETVIYLASLASDTRTIDPLLDPVRAITSRGASGAPAVEAPGDLATLQGVQQQLEEYLTHSDPARVFTVQELQQKVADHLLSHRFDRLRKYLLEVIVAMLVMFGAAFALPGAGTTQQRGQLGATLALITLSAGAGWFYVSSRQHFKIELRPAYTLLCVSSLLLGASQIQLPIVAYYNLGATPLFRYGGINTATFLAMICVYFAVQRYARTIGVPRSPLASTPVVALALAAIAAAAVLIPHSSHPDNEALFDFSMAVMSANMLLVFITSAIAHSIARITSAVYARAMNFLTVAQVTAGIGLALFLGFLYVQGSLYGTRLGQVASSFVLSSVFWLLASYAFMRASEY